MRRFAALVGVLLIISFVIFLLLYLAPGSPEQLLLGPRQATPETVAAIRHEYHLDDPFLVQYWDWLEERGRSSTSAGRSARTRR